MLVYFPILGDLWIVFGFVSMIVVAYLYVVQGEDTTKMETDFFSLEGKSLE
jgi:hypothetical protein